MDSPPLVSIIMPTYNREQYVGEAIESVLQQTYPHFELIIIDDGSTDKTEELISPLLSDSRIRYFKQSNQGQSPARNAGLAKANGQYLCFLDSDNRWFPDKLRVCIDVLEEKPEYDVVYGDNISIDAGGHTTSTKNMKRYTGRITAELLKDNFVTNNTATFRRECYDRLGGLDEELDRAPDYDFWLRLSVHYAFVYIPKKMALYRIMANQISSDKSGRFKANEKILKNFLQRYPQSVSRRERRLGLSCFYLRKSRYDSAHGQPWPSLKAWYQALCHDPFWVGPWKTAIRIALDRTRFKH